MKHLKSSTKRTEADQSGLCCAPGIENRSDADPRVFRRIKFSANAHHCVCQQNSVHIFCPIDKPHDSLADYHECPTVVCRLRHQKQITTGTRPGDMSLQPPSLSMEWVLVASPFRSAFQLSRNPSSAPPVRRCKRREWKTRCVTAAQADPRVISPVVPISRRRSLFFHS